MRKYVPVISVLLGVWVWQHIPVQQVQWFFYPFLLLVMMLMSCAAYAAKQLRRRAFLRQYLQPTSFWQRVLATGVVAWLLTLPVAPLLALVLLLSVRSVGAGMWWALLLGAGVFVLAQHVARRWLAAHVLPVGREAIGRKLSVYPAVLSMLLVFVVAQMFATHPNYVGVSVEQLWPYLVGSVDHSSAYAFWQSLLTALQTLQLWAMENAMATGAAAAPLSVLGWGVFFLLQGGFAWAFGQLLWGAEALMLNHSQQVHENE